MKRRVGIWRGSRYSFSSAAGGRAFLPRAVARDSPMLTALKTGRPGREAPHRISGALGVLQPHTVNNPAPSNQHHGQSPAATHLSSRLRRSRWPRPHTPRAAAVVSTVLRRRVGAPARSAGRLLRPRPSQSDGGAPRAGLRRLIAAAADSIPA